MRTFFIHFFEEDGVYVAYSSNLELSTQTDTRSEAKVAFEEAMSMFLDDLIKSKNLLGTLKELGWKTQEAKAYKKSPLNLKSEKISNFQYSFA